MSALHLGGNSPTLLITPSLYSASKLNMVLSQCEVFIAWCEQLGAHDGIFFKDLRYAKSLRTIHRFAGGAGKNIRKITHCRLHLK